MPSLTLFVANVKCEGCVTNIINGMTPLSGVDGVEVNQPTGEVTISGVNLDQAIITSKLNELGYPVNEQ